MAALCQTHKEWRTPTSGEIKLTKEVGVPDQSQPGCGGREGGKAAPRASV